MKNGDDKAWWQSWLRHGYISVDRQRRFVEIATSYKPLEPVEGGATSGGGKKLMVSVSSKTFVVIGNGVGDP